LHLRTPFLANFPIADIRFGEHNAFSVGNARGAAYAVRRMVLDLISKADLMHSMNLSLYSRSRSAPTRRRFLGNRVRSISPRDGTGAAPMFHPIGGMDPSDRR
jgi:hypothetical protein